MPAILIRINNTELINRIKDLEDDFDGIEAIIQPFAPSADLLSPGDFVWFANPDDTGRYRNEFTFVWTGSKLVNLDYETDDDGNLPSSFVITDTQYDPMWWLGVNGRTTRLYLANDIMKRIIFPADATAETTVSIVIGTKTWNVQIDTEDEMTPEHIAVMNRALQMGRSTVVFTDSSRSCDNPENTFFVLGDIDLFTEEETEEEEEIEIDDAGEDTEEDAEEEIEIDDTGEDAEEDAEKEEENLIAGGQRGAQASSEITFIGLFHTKDVKPKIKELSALKKFSRGFWLITPCSRYATHEALAHINARCDSYLMRGYIDTLDKYKLTEKEKEFMRANKLDRYTGGIIDTIEDCRGSLNYFEGFVVSKDYKCVRVDYGS
jgi:hypothetical protein